MAEAIFQPEATGKDTYLDSSAPGAMRGGFVSMTWGWFGIPFNAALRPVGEFDISSIPPGSTIVSVALDIWITSADSGSTDGWLRRLLQPAWEELEATWNMAYTGADGWDDDGLVGGWFTNDDEQAFTSPSSMAGDPFFHTISGAGLAAQCQWALDNFAGRYMWEMMKDVEAGATKRFTFSSSEALSEIGPPVVNPRPRLTINYVPPPIVFDRQASGLIMGTNIIAF